MGGFEGRDALIAHGKEVLELFKEKKTLLLSDVSSKNGKHAELPPDHGSGRHKDKLWAALVAAQTQNGQLTQAIERNALKLADYIQANDKGSSSNLAQLSAPIISTLRQQFHQKQQLDTALLRDIKVLGPPILLEDNDTVHWMDNPQLKQVIDAQTSQLEDDLKQANQTIKAMEVKLHAYRVQIQQNSQIASAPPSQNAGAVDTTGHPNQSQPHLERQIVEKDELIRALKETLDEVARESSRMEKLVVSQMDTIAELKQAALATAQARLEPEGQVADPESQKSDGIEEPIPVDDGHSHKIEDFETPLPPGWEMRVTNSGNVYFVHATSKVTTWVDPRTHPIQVQPATDPINNNAPFIPVPSSHYSIEFHEKRRIGIIFQPNTPLDLGACVRRVLDETPASVAKEIQPGHQLVAVNGHQIKDASFKHVMLLLQGGYRPLTLTFDRVARGDETLETKEQSGPQEFSLADRIITSVFSLMWSLPEETIEHI